MLHLPRFVPAEQVGHVVEAGGGENAGGDRRAVAARAVHDGRARRVQLAHSLEQAAPAIDSFKARTCGSPYTLAIINRGGATAKYARAITLDPKNSDAYNNRGSEKQDAGDLDGAMADYSHAIEANPNDSFPYYNRGAIYFLRRDWNKAIPDLQHHDELNEEDEEAPALIWIARVRLGEKEAADRELAKFISDHPDWADSWNTKIDNFLLGRVSEQDLLAAIDSSEAKKQHEQQCE